MQLPNAMPPLRILSRREKLLFVCTLFLNNNRGEALGVLDVHSLNVAVQLLLGTLLVVSSSGNSHADSVVDTLDTVLPDLLVELGVDSDISGTL